jgi:DNA-binding response OmpR family regulator
VLVLTARSAWTERVEGINLGADDYLPKPFQMEELVARVRALIRRSAGQAAPVLRAGALSLDTRRMEISLNGEVAALSPLEYRLLAFLIHHAGRVVPPTELAEHLYDSGNERDPNAIEVIVARLRRKLGNDVIETRRGFGYRVADGAEQ